MPTTQTTVLPGKVREKSGSDIEQDLGAVKLPTGGVYENLPYKGPPIVTKDSDPEYKKPQLTYESHVQVFNMSDPKDKEAYGLLLTKMMKGLSGFGQRRVVYDRELKTFLAYVEWTDQFYIAPPVIAD